VTVVVGAVAAGVATGGLATKAGLGFWAATGTTAVGGAGYSAVQDVGQQGSEIGFGLRDEFDWKRVGRGAVINLATGLVGGAIAGKLSQALQRTLGGYLASASDDMLMELGRAAGLNGPLPRAYLASSGSRIAAEVVSEVGAAPFTTTLSIVLNNYLSGRPLPGSVGEFLDLVVTDMAQSGVLAATVGRVTYRAHGGQPPGGGGTGHSGPDAGAGAGRGSAGHPPPASGRGSRRRTTELGMAVATPDHTSPFEHTLTGVAPPAEPAHFPPTEPDAPSFADTTPRGDAPSPRGPEPASPDDTLVDTPAFGPEGTEVDIAAESGADPQRPYGPDEHTVPGVSRGFGEPLGIDEISTLFERALNRDPGISDANVVLSAEPDQFAATWQAEGGQPGHEPDGFVAADGTVWIRRGANETLTLFHEVVHKRAIDTGSREPFLRQFGSYMEEAVTEWLTRRTLGPHGSYARHGYDAHVALLEAMNSRLGIDPGQIAQAYLDGDVGGLRETIQARIDDPADADLLMASLRNLDYGVSDPILLSQVLDVLFAPPRSLRPNDDGK